MTERTFKKHNLSQPERAWLTVAMTPGFDPKVAEVVLRNKLPPRYNPNLMDRRLYSGAALE